MQSKSTDRGVPVLAFVSTVPTTDGKGIVGAALVTDDLGFPLEFRCTHSVRATAVQKILYGGALDPFIAVEVCGKALLSAIVRSPGLILVNRRELMGVSRFASVPVVYVAKAGENLRLSGEDGSATLNSPDTGYEPIVVRIENNAKSTEAEVRQILSKAFKGVDLLEPFSRITAAVSALSSQDSKFS